MYLDRSRQSNTRNLCVDLAVSVCELSTEAERRSKARSMEMRSLFSITRAAIQSQSSIIRGRLKIARPDNVAPSSRGGHRETCFDVLTTIFCACHVAREMTAKSGQNSLSITGKNTELTLT